MNIMMEILLNNLKLNCMTHLRQTCSNGHCKLQIKITRSSFSVQEKLKGVRMPNIPHPKAVSVELLNIKLKYLQYHNQLY